MVLRNMIEQPTLRDSKYIFNVCKEFTTLNRQEDVNLKEIINFNKLLKRRKEILWIAIK